ncbi:MAG: ribonuclease R [Pseudolabrys sp.]|nr:ribonuclease R [Pseudolabrys sp.]
MKKPTPHDPNTLPSKAAILDFIAGNPGKVGTREIARAFGLKNNLRAELKQLLRDLAADGAVARGGHKGKKLHHPGALASTLLADIVSRDRDGEFIAVPDEWDEDEHDAAPRIRIHSPRKPRPGEAAGLGDKVLLHVDEVEPEDGIRYRGRIIKIIERVKHRVLGIFRADARGGGRLEPVDKKMLGRELHIPQGATGDAQDGDLIAVEAQRTSRFGPPNGRIVERLGSLKSEKAVSLIAIHSHSIPDVFRRDTINEAEAAKPATLSGGREDWRKLPLITIDPADAKDHDDAVHAAADDDPANPGGFVITVAIADVAHYVTPGSALDREALVRGNSVYFPDRVVPMLPERISNDLCSLKPHEDRAALAVQMIVGADGRKRSHKFHRIMMRSAAKLAYEQAQAAIDGRPDDTTGPLLEPILKPLYAAYEALKREREERGPLDLDLPERKILLKPDGMVDRVVVPGRLDAHRLIEEMMILANVAAAESLEKARTPLIYRVHDEPGIEKINALREFLASLDINIAKAGALRAANFNFVLGRVKNTDRETLVNEVVLRSQAQAEYSAENYGHFGLNLRRYAHFTSPIRRYADLIVHRALIRALHLGHDGLPASFGLPELAEIAAEISATERRAMLAERETKDRLIAHFLADRIGATFEGKVGGVHRAGLFIKLSETGADGFVPARTIGDEYFRYDEAGHALTGTRTGESFRLGDSVTVKLVEAAPVAGALRFELLSHGRRGTPPAGRERVERGRLGKKTKFKDYGRKADKTFRSDTAKGHDEKKRSEERRRKFGKKNSRHKVRKNKGKRK